MKDEDLLKKKGAYDILLLWIVLPSPYLKMLSRMLHVSWQWAALFVVIWQTAARELGQE